MNKKNILLSILLCLFLLSVQSLKAQPPVVGTQCDRYNELYTQEVIGEIATTVNGQLFVADSDYDDVVGIYLVLEALPAGSHSLDLYSGSTLPDYRDGLGTPIASSTINLASDILLNQQTEVLFEFNTPVSLTDGESYYFILEGSINSAIIWATGVNPIDGGIFRMFSQAESSTTTFFISSRDIGFGLYDCSAIPPCTVITDITVLSEAECNDNDATFSLSFDVTNGSGNYNIVATEANDALGIAANQVLGSITDGDTDADDVQIMGSIPNTTEAGSVSVRIVDEDNKMCVLSLGVPVAISACASSEPLPAMNRWGLLLLSMLVLSIGIFAYRKF